MTPRLPRTALSRGPVGSLPELAARYLEEYLDKIRLAAERLTEDQVWWRPAPGTNSAGNLILHLCGNLSLWLLAGVGGRHYERHRSEELAADRTHGKAELLARLEEVVAACRGVLAALEPEDLGRPAAIQGYDTDLLGAVFHAVEHMSYHTGQIVWIAKELGAGGRPFELYPQHRGE
ncbi:MAG TPA: DinB family protein [Thermoanaerobaculia bacterium]|nr:DinB family protein [Thermoanaerobaculia bacterium]